MVAPDGHGYVDLYQGSATAMEGAIYTTYPYLARLRDRNVLEDGLLSTLDSPIDWEHQGFALAEGWDGQNYTGLVLPTDSARRPATVDALLLVDPVRAEQQRQREIDTRPRTRAWHARTGRSTTRWRGNPAATPATAARVED